MTETKIGGTTFATPTDTEIVVTRLVDAPRQLVFDCHSRAEHLPHWMTGPDGWTMTVRQLDLRPGGAWHFVWHKADGEEMEMRGVYREVAPPERLVATESWGGEWPDTVNTVVLTEEADGKTRITQTITYVSREARDAALATGMRQGMNISYGRMDAYLATRV